MAKHLHKTRLLELGISLAEVDAELQRLSPRRLEEITVKNFRKSIALFPEICGHELVVPNTRLDELGIDAVIYTRGWQPDSVTVQLKTSASGCATHLQKMARQYNLSIGRCLIDELTRDRHILVRADTEEHALQSFGTQFARIKR